MMAANGAHSIAAYRRAGEAVLRYLLATGTPRRMRYTAAGKALICLAGSSEQQRFVETLKTPPAGRSDAASAGERSFCAIADAQGWDDHERDRLELLVETLLDDPAVRKAVAALVTMLEAAGRRVGATETQQL